MADHVQHQLVAKVAISGPGVLQCHTVATAQPLDRPSTMGMGAYVAHTPMMLLQNRSWIAGRPCAQLDLIPTFLGYPHVQQVPFKSIMRMGLCLGAGQACPSPKSDGCSDRTLPSAAGLPDIATHGPCA